MFSSCRVTVTMLHVCRLFVRTNQQSSQCRLLSLNRKKRHRKSTCVCFMTHYTYTSFFFILCSDQFVIINMPNVYLSFITYLGTMYLIYKHESLTDPGKEENLACFVSITKIKVKQAKDMFRPFTYRQQKKVTSRHILSSELPPTTICLCTSEWRRRQRQNPQLPAMYLL